MSKEKKIPEDVSDADLDQVQGGLLAHELTHVTQESNTGGSYILPEVDDEVLVAKKNTTDGEFLRKRASRNGY